MGNKPIEALLDEQRLFAPPEDFVKNANVKDEKIYEEGKNIEDFWAKAAENIDWFKKWDKVLEWNPPFAKWFVGGKLNVSYNCLDRHIKTHRKNKAAIIWEGEPGDEKVYTYWDLYREVCKFANVLKQFGVKKGDRVTIYMPMIPELPIAMLACCRIGAPHSVVFGGFSADSLVERITDSESKIVITADGGYRRGSVIPLKRNVDEALEKCPFVENVIVVKRVGDEARIHMKDGRDHWWIDLMDEAKPECPAEEMDSEDMLYILYTSGTTGKPKGIVHTTGGYLVGTTLTSKLIFDLKEEDTYWCTADIGWVTGHSYIVYGILSNGATSVMYEGSPDYPEKDRFWEIVEKYNVNILYTAPTAIRTFMKWGEEWPKKRDLSSLRLLGTVGEPINPEAWIWYHKNIGNERCPIVDTWWQTETGMILISPLPGIVKTKPGSATKPFPGIEAKVLDDNGNEVPPDAGGFLVLTKPWPAMLRTIYKDPERFKQQYWSKYENIYFTGDGAKKDKDGYFWVMGRVDDVINVSGHRLSTMEIESALVDHKAVAESAVIGKTHEVKGQAVAAFVTLREGFEATQEMEKELKEHVAKKIGAMARPEDVFFTHELPKTRSGKIMRRLLRDIAERRALGDVTTLADPTVIEKLKQQYEEE
ncbi:MAG: acetate--CoA ligase [Candidatus Schekmanbacteria bacterium]|nr:MAG: acetate--CoA ligase [Candidatus Schekmanbacteria bacterium]